MIRQMCIERVYACMDMPAKRKKKMMMKKKQHQKRDWDVTTARCDDVRWLFVFHNFGTIYAEDGDAG